jgi:hypothetical protein
LRLQLEPRNRGGRSRLEGLATAAEEPARRLLLLERLRREVFVADEKVDSLVGDRPHVHRTAHAQVEVLLEPAVVVGDDLFRREIPVGGVEAQADLGHTGQVVHPMCSAEPQRRPAMLPRAARSWCPIQHHEVLLGDEFEAAQIVGDRQAGLPGADHHDLHALGTLHHLTISTRVAVYAQYTSGLELHGIAHRGPAESVRHGLWRAPLGVGWRC